MVSCEHHGPESSAIQVAGAANSLMSNGHEFDDQHQATMLMSNGHEFND